MNKLLFFLAMILFLFPANGRSEEITRNTVDKMIISYIQNYAPVGVEMVEWKFRHSNPLPIKGEIIDFERPVEAGWKAHTSLRMKVNTGGREQTFWITLHLVYSRGVVVAGHNLSMGHRIVRNDIKVEVREGWKYLEKSYSQMDEVLGKGIERPVSKGTCIKNWHIRHDQEMKRGDAVVILAQKGCLRVEAPGKVLEVGTPGELVRVLNTLSGKEVFATVLDTATVSVSF